MTHTLIYMYIYGERERVCVGTLAGLEKLLTYRNVMYQDSSIPILGTSNLGAQIR